ncbi:hypothetical protein OAP01_02650, partial [Akkermansiaceae bacterium]|nr:hypothetical protein [Akkermansiaceae bacterium]
ARLSLPETSLKAVSNRRANSCLKLFLTAVWCFARQRFFVAEGIKRKCRLSHKGTHDVNTRPVKIEALN